MAFTFDLDGKGYLKKRESYNLEYKQNFQLGDGLLKFLKTLAGMANNKGGQIVFGVLNSPHIPAGMTNNRFLEVDPKDIDSRIREYFAPSLRWRMDIQEFNDKKFGFLIVEEAEEKPILCKKNKGDILREGAIYYRYRGETKEIEYAELKRILDQEKEKERILWIKHIEKISTIGPRYVHLLDSYKGELSIGDNKVLLDKSVIDKLNFIKEGHFVEKDGEGLPTLRLIGDVEGVDIENVAARPDVLYPLTTNDLQKKLNVNSYEIQAILHTLDIKKKTKYHAGISIGNSKTHFVHKYAESLIPLIQRMMSRDNFLQDCIAKYKDYCNRRTKIKKHKRKK